MNAVTPYSFDGLPVRTVAIEGEPYFVGKDVADALGYTNASDAFSKHCKGVAKRYPIADAMGRVQETRLLSEPDVLRLIINSKLPAAERFERWVFEDVLPSIRRTGSYQAAKPQRTGTVAALLAIGKAVSRVPGVKPEMAMSVTLNLIERVTGLPATGLRLALPGAPTEETLKMNATQLGERVGKKAREVNAALVTLGYQSKTERGYVVTEAGSVFGEMTPFTRHGHSGYQPLWYEGVIEPLGRHFASPSNVIPMGGPRSA